MCASSSSHWWLPVFFNASYISFALLDSSGSKWLRRFSSVCTLSIHFCSSCSKYEFWYAVSFITSVRVHAQAEGIDVRALLFAGFTVLTVFSNLTVSSNVDSSSGLKPLPSCKARLLLCSKRIFDTH